MRTYSFLVSFLVAIVSVMATPVKVTFNFEGIDGKAIEGRLVVNDQWKSTADKLVVFDLEPGKHVFSFSPEGGSNVGKLVPSLRNIEFNVGSEDLEIDPFKIAGLKKVKLVARGEMIKGIRDISLSYDFDLGELLYGTEKPVYFMSSNLRFSHKNDFIGNDYIRSDEMFAYAYLFPGEYEYDSKDTYSNSFLEEYPIYKLNVNDKEDLQIVNLSFSSDEWHQIVFKIVDDKGAVIDGETLNIDKNLFYEIKNSKGQCLRSSEDYFNIDTLFFKDGNYSFAANKEEDRFKDWQKINVENSGFDFYYQYLDEVRQNVNVRMTNAPANKEYVISFYTNGFVDWSEDMLELTTDNSGKASETISLSEGVYNYTILEPRSSYHGKVDVKAGVECVIDLNGYKEYTINPVDENGNLIESEYGNFIVLYQNNNCVSQNLYPYPNNYTGLLKEGDTYEVWSAASSIEYTADLRTIVIGEENELDIKLKKSDTNNYYIQFSVDDDTPDFALSGRVTLDGTDLVPGLFFDYLYACIYNVPEGEYNYTIELNRYETIHGTVKVGPETADDGVVYVDFDDALVEKTTSINNTTVKENIFSVYPSVVDDYINISNKNANKSIWNVTLYSASGTVVCSDRILPDSDTASVYVGNLYSGFYLMVIENETGRYTYKIMKR